MAHPVMVSWFFEASSAMKVHFELRDKEQLKLQQEEYFSLIITS